MQILKLFLEHKCLNEMSSYTPIVRNGWTKDKIIQYLKKLPSSTGDLKFYRVLNSYSNFDEFKNNLYYHGTTASLHDGLKPSISFPKKWDGEIEGGGGYGVRYWSVSVSKSKVIASNFSSNKDGVSIHPVLVKPDANIINMDLKDSEELEEHIEDLWNRGVDGVYIGGGEQELCLINPSCSVLGSSEYQRVFNIGSRVKNPTDQELLAIWDSRNQKLSDQVQKRSDISAERNKQKLQTQTEYDLCAKELLAAIEKYKNEEISYYPLIQLYRKLHNLGMRVIKQVELLKYKRQIIDTMKTDYEKREMERSL